MNMTTATALPTRPRTAVEVCQKYAPSKDAIALLHKDLSPKAFLDVLVQQGLQVDAVEFLARLLTKEEAIWWGCLCAWDAARPNASPPVQAALQTALRWLQEPSEEHRREAEQAAKRAGIATPAGAAAQAVVFAQGSLSLPGLPEVPAPEDLTSQTIAGAVRVCAAQLGAAGENLPYRRMLRYGLEVAAGKNRWQ